MSFLKKYLSYINIISEKKIESVYNGVLEINWVNGKKVLDTQNTNYSFGNLGKVLHKGLKNIDTDFINENCKILILGMGAGDIVHQLQSNFKSKAHITAVEIDPKIIEIAINEFGIILSNKLEIIQNDAFQYLKYCSNTFDVIIIDLFHDVEIPDFVFQQSFINSLNNALNKEGSLIFNTFILNEQHKNRNQRFLDILNKLFKTKSFKNVYGHNHLIIAQKL